MTHIPDEAVEAALKSYFGSWENSPNYPWKESLHSDMRRALEAALAVMDAREKAGPRPERPTWTLADLRAANETRQIEWCKGGDALTTDLAFRAMELGGETGEALNVAKKLERERHGWPGSRATVHDLALELADVVICADLMALAAGIDLMAAVRAKFNAVTDKIGLTTYLAESTHD